MSIYLVSFEIEVDAENPIEACEHAWKLLSAPDALLPVGNVANEDGVTQVDLEAIEEERRSK